MHSDKRNADRGFVGRAEGRRPQERHIQMRGQY
jgi:hypothetical protein